MLNEIEFTEGDGEDVMLRVVDKKTGKMVTIITAGEETLGSEGPLVTQISDDQVIVMFSDEYVKAKMDAAVEKNHEEFGDMAFTIGFSYILNQAMKAVQETFLDND
jgi:hypothetical protein